MAGPKSFEISKQVVYEAFLRVKANKGAAGVDEESIDEFERNLKRNLYKLWNRMSSGTYDPANLFQLNQNLRPSHPAGEPALATGISTAPNGSMILG
jgi:hypothetical protein